MFNMFKLDSTDKFVIMDLQSVTKIVGKSTILTIFLIFAFFLLNNIVKRDRSLQHVF